MEAHKRCTFHTHCTKMTQHEKTVPEDTTRDIHLHIQFIIDTVYSFVHTLESRQWLLKNHQTDEVRGGRYC